MTSCRYKWDAKILTGSKLCELDIHFMSAVGVYLSSYESSVIGIPNQDDAIVFIDGEVLVDGSFVFAEASDVKWVVCASTRKVKYVASRLHAFPSHIMSACIRKFSLLRRLLFAATSSPSARQFYRYSLLMQKLDPVAFRMIPFNLGQDVTSVTTIWEEMLLYNYWSFEDSEEVYEEEYLVKGR